VEGAGVTDAAPSPSNPSLRPGDRAGADPERALGALSEVPDACGTCTRCIDACPTQAITPYSVDASRCISYLTIERREPLPAWAEGGLTGWLFGCDICQEVCPHNSPRQQGVDVGERHEAYTPREGRADLELREVLAWTAEDRSRELSGSSMKRATLAMLKRNASLLLAGGPDPATRAALAALADDDSEHPIARDAARRALAPPSGR
jgi:epoxyqueuosine reductase